MVYKSFKMLLGRSSGFCRQNTSHGTLSRSHFTLFTCTAWLNVSQICLHKTFTSIHMSSMFDELSPIFPRFHSLILPHFRLLLPSCRPRPRQHRRATTLRRSHEMKSFVPIGHTQTSHSFRLFFNLFFLVVGC